MNYTVLESGSEREKNFDAFDYISLLLLFHAVFVSLAFKRHTRFMWISNCRNYNAPQRTRKKEHTRVIKGRSRKVKHNRRIFVYLQYFTWWCLNKSIKLKILFYLFALLHTHAHTRMSREMRAYAIRSFSTELRLRQSLCVIFSRSLSYFI